MPELVSYGSYAFPTPIPLVGEGGDMVFVAGNLDHFLNKIDIVGTITGANLSGIYLQKMQMISGMLPEFKTLWISNDSITKQFVNSKPVSINFSQSDLTTVLPYSVSFESYGSGIFSKFFGITNPQDTWDFNEQDGRITKATHTVSADGVTGDGISALVNARNFVTGRTTGFANLSLFQTGINTGAFLTSRTEDINKAKNTYSLTEVYDYTTSDRPINSSGVVQTSTSISYSSDSPLSVQVQGSVYGSIDANLPSKGGLVGTGSFTASQAEEVAVNAVASSLSDYESGAYTFISRGPTTYDYTINSGENKVDFSFSFNDPDNIDQSGNILHTKTATIEASKDNAVIGVGVGGSLKYNSTSSILGTGDPIDSARFKEVDAAFSGVKANSGFLNLAIEALQDFREDATGYHISGNYINPIPLSRSITKTPSESTISYNLKFDNRIDLASGLLTGLKVNIKDKKPIELSGIVPSIVGYADQKISNRTIGRYSISASCEATTGEFETLEKVISGYITGIYDISKSDSVNEQTISFNLSRYY